MLKLLFLTLTLSLVFARLGFDASAGPFNANHMSCMRRSGFTFAIFRGYCSYGAVDRNIRANIAAAHAGGIGDVGVYIFPCPRCGNPRNQVIATVNALRGLAYNTIWIDVERYAWNLNNKGYNRNFLAQMFDEATKHGKSTGIYTSSAEWSQIVGNDWTAGARFWLWWARWDGIGTLNNFQPFAGWRSCFIKQYLANRMICGVGYDANAKN
eukprot:TRINITY_DN622_c0_g1_i10.p1 TRINITY_DN622_c0_g1~~TRINITY_DN622_c0_g1_i10.p1  ORF type:complete len:211 (+),score=31.49 TRINITY_DN622_c0_g1_i10:239-871(+)